MTLKEFLRFHVRLDAMRPLYVIDENDNVLPRDREQLEGLLLARQQVKRETSSTVIHHQE